MYAIVQIPGPASEEQTLAAGQQFKVSKGLKITTNRFAGDVGETVSIGNVMLLATDDGVKVGSPYIDGAEVKATIVEHKKGDKVIVFKKKRRKRYRVLKGHRQALTVLEIQDITA